MRIKWLLTALPVVVFGVLAQSALWVPTYESQAAGNPQRLLTFVRASIADVKTLNPIFSSELLASQVLLNNVTEALVDVDQNRKLVPRLAERWQVTEEAYLSVLPGRKFPDGTAVTPESLLAAVTDAWRAGRLSAAIEGVELVPPEAHAITETVLVGNEKAKQEPLSVAMTVRAPARVRFRLSAVEPLLFANLEGVVGAAYFQDYPLANDFQLERPELLSKVQSRFPELLPIAEHNPVIIFYLRAGVEWHDGVPFTAADVKFTYDAYIDPKNASPRASLFEPIKSLEVENERRVRVTYKRLYSPGILDWCLPIVPKHLLDRAAIEREMSARGLGKEARATFSLRDLAYNRRPVGTGPFVFSDWRTEESIKLTRNEHYWGKKAEYHDVYFRVIPDFLTMELEFRAGALDRYDALPHQAERYRNDPDYRVLSTLEGYYAYIAYNLRLPLFQDLRVRKALGMAIDVDSIIKYALYGEGRRSTGPFFSSTPFNDPEVKPLPYDPNAAAALLRAAGWQKNAAGILEKGGKPLQFTLITNNANPQRKAIMTIAQEAWRKLGIDCKTQVFEWSVFVDDVQQDRFDAVVLAWSGGDLNPDIFSIWHSSQTHPYERNYAAYRSAQADDLLSRIRMEYDAAAQIELTHELHRVIAADQPYTFLFEPFQPVVLDRRIVRVLHSANGSASFEKIEVPPSGSVTQFFSEWRKLEQVPSDLVQ